ncbi:MAG: 23S rRNA (guanosine(2251)-2'-O)-methyltransferase RlmB [Proteobacteria bacterium]|nr:23S rRNA (guanosine(2251)-2'-O)-methyltransferase RlmB [Pseudomonadota bacterium]
MRESQLYGRHPVLEALRGGQDIDKVFLLEGAQETEAVREIRRRLRERRIPFSTVSKAVLDRLAGTAQHQGVVASVPTRDYADWDDVLALAARRKVDPRVLVLDEVQDPRNLGSMIRSADAAGFHGVAVTQRRAAGLTGVVSKTSAGADAHVPVVKIGNVAQFLEKQAEAGFSIVGADASGTVDYRDARYEGPVIVVVGGEHKGLGRLVSQKCHQVVRIPMRGEVDSLNVSVAAALLMYESTRAWRA